jgi:hypothetical protein
MSTVVIGRGKVLTLTPNRELIFSKELAACKRRRHTRRAHPDVAADCYVEVAGGGTPKRYGIYGRTVIRDEATRQAWQFYFGLLLLEWLR